MEHSVLDCNESMQYNVGIKPGVIKMDNGKIKVALIDGYLDEPSCLGVPPYISPHIRYTYGALIASGIRETNLDYFTVDQLRENREERLTTLESYDLVVIIAGTTVPGHYLGGKPISLKEIEELGQRLYYPQKVLGGPVTLVKKEFASYDYICREIAGLDLYQLLTDQQVPPAKITEYIADWAVSGAELTVKHPFYPNLVCEIETFRGCPRYKHCAFCSERLKKKTYQRQPLEIIREVKALAGNGNHFFRLGCQTDLLLYQAKRINNDKFLLNPDAVQELYQGIREADPGLKVLHLDNINPANITRYYPRSQQILETIVKYNTPGDIAAFGLESADPLVLKKNNIEAEPEDTFRAIEILNEIGGSRKDGIPRLLPGLNFLHGLIGERKETMEHNYNYLKRILEAGLMLRRINIRQVMGMGNYPVAKVNYGSFLEYKERINKEINKPMLQRVFPVGTVIRNVLTETRKGKLTYGRQLGSYPILIGIPGQLKLNQFIDVKVVDYGYRSLTALPWPFNLKKASLEQLTSIPGIGKKRANRIFLEQPDNPAELKKILGPDFPVDSIKEWFF